MNTSNSWTEISNLCVHDHPCLIYETEEEHKSAFVPYLQSGLLRGERCAYILHDNSTDYVVDAMEADNFDVELYIRSGQFVLISTKDAYLDKGHFDTKKMIKFWSALIDDSVKLGYPSVRVAAEMTWALENFPGVEQLVSYESELNTIFPHEKITALCQYNRKSFRPNVIKEMIHVHPLVVAKGELLENPAFIAHDEYVESDEDMDVRALLDNLAMGKELIKANRQLKEVLSEQESARQKIQALYDELHTMSYSISHEMQEPLSIIVSYLRLLSVRYGDKLGDDADEFINKSVAGAKTISRMIDDLWIYSRVPSQQMEKSVDSLQMLGELLDETKEDFVNRRADVSYDSLPVLTCCREQLKFVLKQLIDNATQYGGILPRVRVEGHSIKGGWQFSVHDNGPGIDVVSKDDLFKMFFRLGKRPDETGSGMGLALARRMVENHNGQIWFESTPGQGACFHFTIMTDPNNEIAQNEIEEFSKRRHDNSWDSLEASS